jgi:hypothetical protein
MKSHYDYPSSHNERQRRIDIQTGLTFLGGLAIGVVGVIENSAALAISGSVTELVAIADNVISTRDNRTQLSPQPPEHQ